MKSTRLLISVFNSEEVRAAVQGGADIIDCEDPRVEVGMFTPRTVSDIANAVNQSEIGQKKLRISANIGFGLLLYRASMSGHAIQRNIEEIQAKAAQVALGMASSMDVGDNRPNIIKFGIDGLQREHIAPVVNSVKTALAKSSRYQDHQVICAMLETNLQEWNNRKKKKSVIESLLQTNHFYFSDDGEIDARDYIDEKKLADIMLQANSKTTNVRLIEPCEPANLNLPDDPIERIKFCVEEISRGGADGVMIDTPVSAKSARICLLDHDQNKNDIGKDIYGDNLPAVGIFNIDLLKMFCEYSQYLYMESWLAGSIQPFHAQELGMLHSLDVIVCRGGASSNYPNPFGDSSSGDQRYRKRIDPIKVSLLVEAVRGLGRVG